MVKKAITKKKKSPLVERGKQIIGKRTKDDPALFLGQVFQTQPDDEFYDIISINFNTQTLMAKPNDILHSHPRSKPRKFKFYDVVEWMDLGSPL